MQSDVQAPAMGLTLQQVEESRRRHGRLLRRTGEGAHIRRSHGPTSGGFEAPVVVVTTVVWFFVMRAVWRRDLFRRALRLPPLPSV